jgi:mycothiol synthase
MNDAETADLDARRTEAQTTLRRFLPEAASEADFGAITRFINRVRAETQPGDPPRTPEATRKNALGWQHLKDVDVQAWYLWRGPEVVGDLFVPVAHREDNRHILDVRLNVLPEYRRQGHARRLLAKLLEIADAEARRLLIGWTNDAVPAGAALAEQLGAEPGMVSHVNQLELADFDRGLLGRWLKETAQSAHAYDLVFVAGPYPEADIADIATLLTAMNTAPRDDLDVEDFTLTPARIRQGEAYHAAQDMVRWALFARHEDTGEYAGATIVYFDPESPEVLQQDDTVVLPAHRGVGLGKRLKAEMLRRVLAERPEIRRVRTGNADSNAPMLKINRALGFRPHLRGTVWQLSRDKLAAYLGARAR